MSQTSLENFNSGGWELERLTPAELEVWEKVETGTWSVRAYARYTERSPGTVGNLLARARAKLEEGSA